MPDLMPDIGLGLAAFLLAVIAGLLGVVASIHALLYKRRPRAAFGWIAVCLTFPLAGALLYFWFGINRARRRARALREDDHVEFASEHAADPPAAHAALARLGETVTQQPLLGGHTVEALHGGEAAYPAMLAAIDSARYRVYLATYLFDTDETGHAFADALGRAVERGVDVRVLLDGVGELYTLPRARRMLHRRKVPVRRFLPPRILPPSFMVNLRNHRKILLIDDELAFSGGMNISDRHLVSRQDDPHRVVDVHFAIRGPVTVSLLSIFLGDWHFAGGDEPARPGCAVAAGTGLCRAIADGPDEELDRLLILLVGAIGLARRRVAIMTPYFVPPRELLGALQAAALRGVDVAILLPGRNNLFFVHRATRHMLWELLQRGVRVYYQPAPFVHSKLLLVDDDYAQIGSANLDPRSLRLNFELTLEVYDARLVAELIRHFTGARAQAEEVLLGDVDGRRMPTRLLDGLAWLFSPYL
jgi:cardiolipin synthase A/B